jgi:predicted RNase H-like HicB family nuclease
VQHLTAIITHERPSGPYEAVAVDLPLPVVTGRSLAEVQDNLLTAIQRHIDEACEEDTVRPDAPGRPGCPDAATIAVKASDAREGRGLILEIPMELVTRS